MSQTPPASAAPTIEGEMFLFNKPELLTKEAHGSLGITRPDRPFAFCETIRAVPLTLSEITTAMRDFPVIFSNEDNPVPLAVLGLIDDVNLFVDDEGEWDQNTYVPGYIRRYPFALATERQATDDQNARMAVILDADYKGIVSDSNMPFFSNGEPSDAMQQAMNFCETYERDRVQTTRFGEALKPFSLLSQQFAQYTPENGEPTAFARYVGVEEAKLNELPDEKFLELRKSGILPILYAHLMSMANWRKILDRRARRFQLTGEAVLKPRTTN
ncbi:MAG: SapC family protein [Pseudomonadota bacterium]